MIKKNANKGIKNKKMRIKEWLACQELGCIRPLTCQLFSVQLFSLHYSRLACLVCCAYSLVLNTRMCLIFFTFVHRFFLIFDFFSLFVQGILTLAEQQKLLAELEGDPAVVSNLGLTPSKLPVGLSRLQLFLLHSHQSKVHMAYYLQVVQSALPMDGQGDCANWKLHVSFVLFFKFRLQVI